MPEPHYNRPLHAIALLTAIATFPLIFMGGLVTSHGAGMSVPDWPNSYGYNMFLFPPRLWIGGILYEHTHRLMGTVVGMLAIVLTIYAWHTQIANGASRVAEIIMRKRISATYIPSAFGRGIRWLCLSVLGAVIFQGVLGGLRVVLVKLDLAIVHACVAQAFFCLTALAAVVTSNWWTSAPDLLRHADARAGRALAWSSFRWGRHSCLPQAQGPTLSAAAPLGRQECLPHQIRPTCDCPACPGRALIAACALAFILIYAQLIAGALMRHEQAGLAVPDFPLAYGTVLPQTDPASLAQINNYRAWDLHLPPVTAAQIWLHMAHRFGAALVTLAILLASGVVILKYRRQRALLIPALVLLALLAVQVTLGILTVLRRKPADVASAHVAVGALVLVCSFVLTIRAVRLYSSWGGTVAKTHAAVNRYSYDEPVFA